MQNMWISIVLIVLVIILGLIAGARLSTPGPQRRAVYFAFGTLAVLAIWFFFFVAFFPAEWIVPFFTVACIVIPICIYMAVARGSQHKPKKASPTKKSFEIPKKDVSAESTKEAPTKPAAAVKVVEASVAKPAEKPAEAPATKPTAKPAEKPATKPIEKPAVATAAKTSEAAPQKEAESVTEAQPAKRKPEHAAHEPKKAEQTRMAAQELEAPATTPSAPTPAPASKAPVAPASATTQPDEKPTEKPAGKPVVPSQPEEKLAPSSTPTMASVSSSASTPADSVDPRISAAADIDILVTKAVAEEIDELEELVRPFGASNTSAVSEQDQGPELNIGSPVSSSTAAPESTVEPVGAAPAEQSSPPPSAPTPAPASVSTPTPTQAQAPTAPSPAPAPAPSATPTPAVSPAQTAQPAPAPKPAKKLSAEESFAEFSARAAALRDQGAYAIAAMLYEEAAALAPTANATRDTQFDELACYVKAGDAQKAKALAAKLRQSSVLTRFERIKLDAVERMG